MCWNVKPLGKSSGQIARYQMRIVSWLDSKTSTENMVLSQNGLFIPENPIKMDGDLRVPPLMETYKKYFSDVFRISLNHRSTPTQDKAKKKLQVCRSQQTLYPDWGNGHQ